MNDMATKTPDIRAVLFDKDGTLFAFDETWATFCDRMFEGLAGSDERIKNQLAGACGYNRQTRDFVLGSAIVNGSADETVKLWAGILPDHSAEDIIAYSHEVLSDLPLTPTCDLHQLMNTLKDRGLKLGVATNDYEAGARTQLSEVSALDLFDFVCGADSGYGVKPGPGMVHGFCRELDLSPEQVVFVGDSTHDLECGRNAGVGLCVGVLTGPARRTDLDGLASVVLNSISELPGYLWAPSR